MTVTTDTVGALDPVRERMLSGARIEADRILARAKARAAVTIDQSRKEAADAVALAAAAGRAQAAPAAAAERARGRERARSVLLGARRAAYDELRGQVLAAVAGLRDEPGYDRLARLAEMAARAAGPGATITAAPDGGIVARSGNVVVDCSLSRLAALAVETLGERVRALWTP